MLIRTLFPPVLLCGLLYAAGAAAADPFVHITQPANGATLDAMAENKLVYEVNPGSRGDHIHVYVDDQEVGILRQLKGSYALETLSPGQHNICIKVVNKGHTPIGVQDCVMARVE